MRLCFSIGLRYSLVLLGFLISEEVNVRTAITKQTKQKRSTPPDNILAGGGSCLEDNKDSLMDDLHNIDILMNDLYNKDSRIRAQHKKDSHTDGLQFLAVEIINKRILIVIQTGSPSSQDSDRRYGSCLIRLSFFVNFFGNEKT